MLNWKKEKIIRHIFGWFMAIVCICVSLFVFFSEIIFRDTIKLNDYVSHNSYDKELPNGERVSVNLEKCYGSFYSKINKATGKYFDFSTFDYYYVVQLNDGSLITIQTDSWKTKKLDNLTKKTLSSQEAKSVHHEGILGGFGSGENVISDQYLLYVENLKKKKIIEEDTVVRTEIISNAGSMSYEYIVSICIFLFGLLIIFCLLRSYRIRRSIA